MLTLKQTKKAAALLLTNDVRQATCLTNVCDADIVVIDGKVHCLDDLDRKSIIRHWRRMMMLS